MQFGGSGFLLLVVCTFFTPFFGEAVHQQVAVKESSRMSVPRLEHKRVLGYRTFYQQKINQLRWSRRLIVGVAILGGTLYTGSKIKSSLFNEDQKPATPPPVPPSEIASMTDEQREKIRMDHYALATEFYKKERERRTHDESLKVQLGRSFKWALATTIALALVNTLTGGTKPVLQNLWGSVKAWWYKDAPCYLDEWYHHVVEQGAVINNLLLVIYTQQSRWGDDAIPVTLLDVLHERELLLSYRVFLTSLERFLGIILLTPSPAIGIYPQILLLADECSTKIEALNGGRVSCHEMITAFEGLCTGIQSLARLAVDVAHNKS